MNFFQFKVGLQVRRRATFVFNMRSESPMFADQTRAPVMSCGSWQLHRQVPGKIRQERGGSSCSVAGRTVAARRALGSILRVSAAGKASGALLRTGDSWDGAAGGDLGSSARCSLRALGRADLENSVLPESGLCPSWDAFQTGAPRTGRGSFHLSLPAARAHIGALPHLPPLPLPLAHRGTQVCAHIRKSENGYILI